MVSFQRLNLESDEVGRERIQLTSRLIATAGFCEESRMPCDKSRLHNLKHKFVGSPTYQRALNPAVS